MMSKHWEHYAQLVEQIDLSRIMKIVDELGEMSDSSGNGVTRLAYTDIYFVGKNYVADLMLEAGLTVEVSPIGNTIGHLSVKNNSNPVIMTGSHTDSVVNAGKYDGIVGVATAIEVARVLYQIRHDLTYPIEVVDFALEEASRFGALRALGSYTLSGGNVSERMLRTTDDNGIALADALKGVKHLKYYSDTNEVFNNSIQEAIHAVELSRRNASSVRGFVELHIEQAQVLEGSSIPIGVVTGAAAPTRLSIELLGQQSHSGTTPMFRRRNALCAASEIVLYVDGLCNSEAEEGIVGAITKLLVEPNSVNTVPGRCLLWLDLRGTEKNSKEQVLKAIEARINRICSERRIQGQIETLIDEDPITFSPTVIEATEASCKLLNIEYCRMPSRAGHDSCDMTRLIPNVGMIFVPSRGGISHHPSEWTDPEHIP